MQLYPDWSSRANTQRGKKRKRKQETTDGGTAFRSVELLAPTHPSSIAPYSPDGHDVLTANTLSDESYVF